jgi:hypothetical protein
MSSLCFILMYKPKIGEKLFSTTIPSEEAKTGVPKGAYISMPGCSFENPLVINPFKGGINSFSFLLSLFLNQYL